MARLIESTSRRQNRLANASVPNIEDMRPHLETSSGNLKDLLGTQEARL